MATWLVYQGPDKLTMAVVLEAPRLFNQYGVMAVNPAKHKNLKNKEAMVFINWLISPEGQAAIGDYKDKHGNKLSARMVSRRRPDK